MLRQHPHGGAPPTHLVHHDLQELQGGQLHPQGQAMGEGHFRRHDTAAGHRLLQAGPGKGLGGGEGWGAPGGWG